jgi:hypothetical protein
MEFKTADVLRGQDGALNLAVKLASDNGKL